MSLLLSFGMLVAAVPDVTPPLPSAPRVLPAYSCQLFGPAGDPYASLSVRLVPREAEESAPGHSLEAYPYSIEVVSDRIELTVAMPNDGTSWRQFKMITRAHPDNRAPRTGLYLTFDGEGPGANGFAVVYEEVATERLAPAYFQPVASGLCVHERSEDPQ